MRNILFFAAFLPLPFLSFLYPWAGILIWGWLALLNPHRDLWGFAANLSYNQIIAVATIAGWLIISHKNRIYFNMTSLLLVLIIFCLLLSTIFSLKPILSWQKFDEFYKIILFAILVQFFLDNKTRFHVFSWLIALCIGYFGVKGGALFIVSGGANEFTGPAGSFIGDRNHLALALVMAIPFLWYLSNFSNHRFLRVGLVAAIVFSVLAIVGTSSRGGFLALSAVGSILWWYSRHKMRTLAMMLPLIVVLSFVVPADWLERIQTIESASEEDSSFKLRLLSWQTHFIAALDRPLTGVGPYSLNDAQIFEKYLPYEAIVDVSNEKGRAAHSIYFQVLGDLGIFSLAVYLLLAVYGYLNLANVVRITKNQKDMAWANELARMMQVSLIGFFVGGAGVSMAFYDLYFILIAMAAALRNLVESNQPIVLANKTTIRIIKTQSIG